MNTFSQISRATYCYLTLALLCLSLIILLYRYFALSLGVAHANRRPRALFPRFAVKRGKSAQKLTLKRVLLTVLLALIVSRALIWLSGLIGALIAAYAGARANSWGAQMPAGEALIDAFKAYAADWRGLCVQWDASHYLGIAENGYVTQGDARFHIVFYPLYPYLTRLLSYLTGDTLLAALLLSNACLFGSGWVLYYLTERTYGEKAGVRSVWLLMLCPAGAFFSVAYTESLFLLLTLLAVYAARRRRFCLAVAFGALSAFTRTPGVIAAVPIFYEMLKSDADAGRFLGADGRIQAKKVCARAGLRVLSCLPVLSGFLAYLLVNRVVTGNALTFLTYQSEHWYQRMGSVLNTLDYTFQNVVLSPRDASFYGIWLPQAIFLPLTAIVIAIGAVRAHPRDGAYALVYYAFTVSPTWLLSGARYLCAMYALYPTLAGLTRDKCTRRIVFALEFLLFGYMSAMYAFKHWLL